MWRNSRSYPHRLAVRRQCTIPQTHYTGTASAFSFSQNVRCMLNFNSHNRFVRVRVRIISALSLRRLCRMQYRKRRPALLALCMIFSITFHCSWVPVCVHSKWGWSAMSHAITATRDSVLLSRLPSISYAPKTDCNDSNCTFSKRYYAIA